MMLAPLSCLLMHLPPLQIDWDYHMMLAKAGTPGQNPELGSIIHFHHFR
jgi:hypothetical protein